MKRLISQEEAMSCSQEQDELKMMMEGRTGMQVPGAGFAARQQGR
jgi:hypothetical protein